MQRGALLRCTAGRCVAIGSNCCAALLDCCSFIAVGGNFAGALPGVFGLLLYYAQHNTL